MCPGPVICQRRAHCRRLLGLCLQKQLRITTIVRSGPGLNRVVRHQNLREPAAQKPSSDGGWSPRSRSEGYEVRAQVITKSRKTRASSHAVAWSLTCAKTSCYTNLGGAYASHQQVLAGPVASITTSVAYEHARMWTGNGGARFDGARRGCAVSDRPRQRNVLSPLWP
jgi:hypothetical protein